MASQKELDSAYMDMAIGCGRIFGIELSRNFNFPYMARLTTTEKISVIRYEYIYVVGLIAYPNIIASISTVSIMYM